MGLATRPGAGKGWKNGTVKALMPPATLDARRTSEPIYKVSMEEARCRALFLALFTPMLTIEGNVPRLRARSAHFVSHLPFTLQLRRKVPTQQDILAPSFKVAVSLTEDETLALAAELLSVVASRRGFQPESSDEEPE